MLYCEPVNDQVLLSKCATFSSVFVLGCPGCANFSLFVQNGYAPDGMYQFTPTGLKALAVVDKVHQLISMFQARKVHVDSWVSKYPNLSMCMVDKENQARIQKKTCSYEAVITLACDRGIGNVAQILEDKKVIAGMQATAIASAVPQKGLSKISLEKDTLCLTPIVVN